VKAVRIVVAFSLLWRVSSGFSQTISKPERNQLNNEVLPTIEAITEKCARASGGREAWAKLSTQVISGTVELTSPPLTGKMEILAKAPNRSVHTFSLANGRFEEKAGFDGNIAWKRDSQKGLRQLQGSELEGAKIEAVFDTDVRLREVYPDMKVVGRTTIAGQDSYAVLTHEPGNKKITFYFDAKTGLRIAEDSEGPDGDGKVEKTNIAFEDYRRVDGIQIPFRLRITSASVSLVINVLEVHHNVALDDSVFAMPSGDHSAVASDSAAQPVEAVDEGEIQTNVYTNRFYAMRYEFPDGWVVHGDETKKRVMELGKKLVAGDDPTRRAAYEVAEKHTQTLLSVFRYPLGTPVDYNPMIEIVSEDVGFAPGIRTGNDYLQNVLKGLKSSSLTVEVEGDPVAQEAGGLQFYRLRIILHIKDKLIYEAFWSTIIKGHALGFVLAARSPEDRDLLEKTMTTLRFQE